MILRSVTFRGREVNISGWDTCGIQQALIHSILTGSLPSELVNLAGTFPNELVGMAKLENFKFYGSQFISTSVLMNGMEFLGASPWGKL
ncbi:hypothetical protein ACHAWX_007346 [Stephanocyclus meneghinianus]